MMPHSEEHEKELEELKESNHELRACRRDKAIQLEKAQKDANPIEEEIAKERNIKVQLESHIVDINAKLDKLPTGESNPLNYFSNALEVVMIENDRAWGRVSSSELRTVFAQVKKGELDLDTTVSFFSEGSELKVQFVRIGYEGIVRDVVMLPDGNLEVTGLYKKAELKLTFKLIETK